MSQPLWSAESGSLATDRGLAYGDGLFETILVWHGQPVRLPQHLHRLRTGCDRLRLEYPQRWLADNIAAALRECSVQLAVLKLLVTRKAESRGYAIPPQATSNCYAYLFAAADAAPLRHPGARVGLCATRLAAQPLLAGMKHLNRLEQVLARSEWDTADVHEGLVRDASDHLVEATASNLFAVYGSELRTPELTQCGVAGVVRAVVLAVAADLGMTVTVAALPLARIAAADEVFLTNSISGIVPVTEFIGEFAAPELEPGQWPVGRWTRQLQSTVAPWCDL